MKKVKRLVKVIALSVAFIFSVRATVAAFNAEVIVND